MYIPKHYLNFIYLSNEFRWKQKANNVDWLLLSTIMFVRSLHSVEDSYNVLILIPMKYSTEWMCHYLLIHTTDMVDIWAVSSLGNYE